MTPGLRAESKGESITLLGIINGSLILLRLESCGRPKMRNSVLEGLRDRKLEDIGYVSVFKVSDVLREIQS